eukprot:GDKJ01017552.1.p2 GENE.GDKJ01017552.1~~GDKJ01017552.1.p2  ORF type:complete len:115 (+),score=5.73 GDKJ01017552.1:590-934(+)
MVLMLIAVLILRGLSAIVVLLLLFLVVGRVTTVLVLTVTVAIGHAVRVVISHEAILVLPISISSCPPPSHANVRNNKSYNNNDCGNSHHNYHDRKCRLLDTEKRIIALLDREYS